MRRRPAALIVLMHALVAGCAREAPVTVPADYREQVEAFRVKRAHEIIAPTGWAALVGLHFLTPGTHSIGSAAASDVRLTGPSAPAALGTITVTPATARLVMARGIEARRGSEVLTDVELKPGAGPEGYLTFGDMSMTLIRRGERLALRVWDAKAPSLTSLSKLDWMPIDEHWRVSARFEPHPAGRSMKILNVLDEVVDMPNPGVAVFSIDGQEHRLEALLESDDAKELFFLFRDGTSGKRTYGAGRYMYTPLPQDGRVILDFNQAKNPPCTFTDFATCPLPPKGNVLTVAVNAGELDHPHK
ncbi:MAG TPA: DUF1684 domain-containing protein [Vicinamibacterales bacterium]|nr:DUF1684 domain-containing protein [Vicinamibacterales bacterium]